MRDNEQSEDLLALRVIACSVLDEALRAERGGAVVALALPRVGGDGFVRRDQSAEASHLEKQVGATVGCEVLNDGRQRMRVAAVELELSGHARSALAHGESSQPPPHPRE